MIGHSKFPRITSQGRSVFAHLSRVLTSTSSALLLRVRERKLLAAPENGPGRAPGSLYTNTGENCENIINVCFF